MAFDPITYPQAEDTFYIAGKPNPGIAQVSGFKRVFSWEVKKGKGIKGSTATLNEYPPCEGSAKILFWLPEHFVAWDSFRALLNYDATKKAVNAVDWYHPSTEDIQLTSVVCKGIGARVHEGRGLYSIVLDFLEYNPPAKTSKPATPGGSKKDANGANGGSGDPAADAKQAEIKRLTDEAKKL